MREIVQVSWYESGLTRDERRQRGHFSTPHALIEQMLVACGYTTSDVRKVRVLDPACGSGNFLAAAARHLCLLGQRMGLSQQRIRELVQRNIWGLDPDPVACFLAEMQIREVVGQVTGADVSSWQVQVHQADSLALSWQPCVDLLLANPPYLATKNTDLSHYHQTRQRGQMDSYLLFLELALQVVRPGGWLALVLPDPVLARSNATAERIRLLQECSLHQLWHLSDVFAAEVGAVALIARKTPARKQHQVAWVRTRWPKNNAMQEPTQRISQSLLASQPGGSLRYLLQTEQGRMVEELRLAFMRDVHRSTQLQVDCWHLRPLEELVWIRRGEEIGRSNAALIPLTTQANCYPVLRGGVDIQPYRQPLSNQGIVRTAIRKPLERYLEPKLLVVKSTGVLQATLDTQGHIVLQTLYLLQLRQREEHLDTAYFLLALLNSRLLRAYVYYLHTAYKLLQPQIEQGVLTRLPIPWGPLAERCEIAQRARELERICSQSGPVVEWDERLTALYEEQERAIGALYDLCMRSAKLREKDKEVKHAYD
jgi:SAM-dependent methyltransferase